MDLGNRIMVMGSSGSGKSTMARRLGEFTGLPVTHLDSISWLPGWVEAPKEEFAEKLREIVRGEAWIIDGNYKKWALDACLERADTVIYLDFSRYVCLFRAFKRRVMFRNKTRPDMGEGCPERITWWLVTWIWGYPKRARGKTLARLAEIQPPKQVIRLKGNRAVKKFLHEIV
ncbi:MAG: AAA family ATPase [Firmicutes bacterium]|nr:AAA family ATPase [Bacillota bacterium]